MSLFRTLFSPPFLHAEKCFMSTFRISYFPHSVCFPGCA